MTWSITSKSTLSPPSGILGAAMFGTNILKKRHPGKPATVTSVLPIHRSCAPSHLLRFGFRFICNWQENKAIGFNSKQRRPKCRVSPVSQWPSYLWKILKFWNSFPIPLWVWKSKSRAVFSKLYIFQSYIWSYLQLLQLFMRQKENRELILDWDNQIQRLVHNVTRLRYQSEATLTLSFSWWHKAAEREQKTTTTSVINDRISFNPSMIQNKVTAKTYLPRLRQWRLEIKRTPESIILTDMVKDWYVDTNLKGRNWSLIYLSPL